MIDIWIEKTSENGYRPGLYCNQSTFSFIKSCLSPEKLNQLEKWIAGGDQYYGETRSIDLEDVKPSRVLNMNYGATMAQSTDSAINSGAGNSKGHVDVNFSTIDYANQKTVYENEIYDIIDCFDMYGVEKIFAYNASFDFTTLNNTIRYISGSGCRWFFPYGTQICDIWNIACQVLGTQKTFQWENIRNDNNNLITNAERMFSYMSQDFDFEEEHTGLADALIETQILARCFRSHKSINKRINRSCWRLCQKVA